MEGRPDSGVRLGPGPAAALTAMLNSTAVAESLTVACGSLPPSVVLRFVFADGRTADAALVTYGCPDPVLFVDGQPRLVDPAVADVLVSDALAYLKSTGAVPDLYGDSAAQAALAATRSGYMAVLGGQVIDPNVAAGSVVLQSPPAGLGDIGNQIEVITATRNAPACGIGQLALDYEGGGAGAGNDFGGVRIRDIGDEPCELVGPIRIVGVNRAGKPVTTRLTYTVKPNLTLSPRAAVVPPGQTPLLPEITALLGLSAEYRDLGTAADGLCANNQIVPASWQLSFPDGTRTVANSSNDAGYPGFSSLLTCEGELNTPEPITIG
jgi:hypothetical protein